MDPKSRGSNAVKMDGEMWQNDPAGRTHMH